MTFLITFIVVFAFCWWMFPHRDWSELVPKIGVSGVISLIVALVVVFLVRALS